MTYENACKAAIAMARQHGCTVHVNARIVRTQGLQPRFDGAQVDQQGYTCSDWCDSSTVATFNAQSEEIG